MLERVAIARERVATTPEIREILGMLVIGATTSVGVAEVIRAIPVIRATLAIPEIRGILVIPAAIVAAGARTIGAAGSENSVRTE